MNKTFAFEGRLPLTFGALLVGLTIAGCAKHEDHLSFAKPEDAVAALIGAARKDDVATLKQIAGPGAEAVLSSGDPVADKQARAHFLAQYDEKHALVPDGEDKMDLQVGADDWPMPIPLVHRDGHWYFDGAAGADEIVYRRVGRNELGAIAVCRGFVDAQNEYASKDRDGEGAGVYAQKLVSDPGTHNGLYWPTAEGEEPSPVGEFVAAAAAEGYKAGAAAPYHGYRYRLLFRQGENANGGAKEYFERGVLANGFALVAWPAEYGVSGVMTFIVDQDGVVFQKDLGDDTDAVVDAMQLFDPDSSWTAVVEPEATGATSEGVTD
jgi:Protein of unknown function (DUF2950)